MRKQECLLAFTTGEWKMTSVAWLVNGLGTYLASMMECLALKAKSLILK